MKQKISHILIETIIVVVGLLIAFQLDRWRESIKEDKLEKKMLNEIKTSLKRDLNELKENLDAHNFALKHYDTVLMKLNQIKYDSLMGRSIARVLRDYTWNPSTGAYESLKEMGLILISDDSLRLNLISLYDFEYVNLLKLEENYGPGKYYDKYYQMLVNNFDEWKYVYDTPHKKVLYHKSKPKDFKTLNRITNLILLNLAEYQHAYIRNHYIKVIEKVTKVIKEIDDFVN